MKLVMTMSVTLLNVLATGPANADTRLDLCDFRPVFMEDFHDISIASRRMHGKRWIAHYWNGDFGDAVFTDPGPNGPFSLKDEALQITARRDRAGRWVSGLIAAANSSGKGYGAIWITHMTPPDARSGVRNDCAPAAACVSPSCRRMNEAGRGRG